MEQSGGGCTPPPTPEHIGGAEGTRGTETSQYPVEKRGCAESWRAKRAQPKPRRLNGLPAYAVAVLYALPGGTAVPPTELPTIFLTERHWNGRP